MNVRRSASEHRPDDQPSSPSQYNVTSAARFARRPRPAARSSPCRDRNSSGSLGNPFRVRQLLRRGGLAELRLPHLLGQSGWRTPGSAGTEAGLVGTDLLAMSDELGARGSLPRRGCIETGSVSRAESRRRVTEPLCERAGRDTDIYCPRNSPWSVENPHLLCVGRAFSPEPVPAGQGFW